MKIANSDKIPAWKNLIEDFKLDQVVRINVSSNCTEKRLVGLNKSIAKIKGINLSTVNLKIFNQIIPKVSPNDLEKLDQDCHPTLCLSPSQENYAKLLEFESREEVVRNAIAASSFGI